MHKTKVTAIPNWMVRPLLFVASILLTVVVTGLRFGKSAVTEELIYPLLCALPICAILSYDLRKRGIFGAVLPVLLLIVIPLLCEFTAIHSPKRSPEDFFKTYVVDPIPAGVTSIQGRYLQEGIFEEVVIIFRASPEALDTIIAQNDFKMTGLGDKDYIDKDLPESSWKGNWVGYHREFYDSGGGLAGYVNMWVDPEQFIVVLRYINGS